MMVNIAIVGMGWAGTRHLQAIRELAQQEGKLLRVVALVDDDAAHLQSKAAEFAIDRTATEYAEVLADEAIDAVSICTPHTLHCPMALAAAEAGKHILVEKPMALTVDDATCMIDAAAANGVRLYVAENASYTPMALFLRDFVAHSHAHATQDAPTAQDTPQNKVIGALTSASIGAGFRAPNFGYAGRRAWLTTLEEGGTGTWMLHGIHTVAQMRCILTPTHGDVATVYVQEHKADSFARTDLEGTMSGLLTFESGLAVSIVQTSESKLPAALSGYVLHGERGSIHANSDGYHLYPTDASTPAESERQSYPAAALSDYALEMKAFAEYVEQGQPGPTTGESERHSLAVVQAGYESAQSQRAVNLIERFGAFA